MWFTTGFLLFSFVFTLVSPYSFFEELSQSSSLSRKYINEGLHSICAEEEVKVLRNASNHFTFIIGHGDIFDNCIFHLGQFLSTRSAVRFRDGFLELIVDLERIDNEAIIHECPDKFYTKLSVKGGRYRIRNSNVDAIRFIFDCNHPFDGKKLQTLPKKAFRGLKHKRKRVRNEKIFGQGSRKSISSENNITEIDLEYDFGPTEGAKVNEWQMLKPTSNEPTKHLFVNVRQSPREKNGNEEIEFVEENDDRISLSVFIYVVCAASMVIGMLCFVLGICTAYIYLKRARTGGNIAEREESNPSAPTKDDAQKRLTSLTHPDAGDKKGTFGQQESESATDVTDLRSPKSTAKEENKAKPE